MQVILVRHADAIDETPALRDPHRYLTPTGRRQAASLGDRLRWHDCEPTAAWTSPLVRAVQTTELIIVALQVTPPPAIEVVPALAPGESPRVVAAALRAVAGTGCVLVVGHEPGLAALATILVGVDVPPLARAEAVRVVDERVRWRFEWNADAPTIIP